MQAKNLTEVPLARGRIVRDEDRAVGKVKLHHYHTYLSSWGPYFILPSLLLAGYVVQQGFSVCAPAVVPARAPQFACEQFAGPCWATSSKRCLVLGGECGKGRMLICPVCQALQLWLPSGLWCHCQEGVSSLCSLRSLGPLHYAACIGVRL